ncbi:MULTISPECIES: hypothetical protein [unclassified Bradyrhizobium]|uniref:hypothetical protein n=1 Tax=unclassified Bradyrhizobium TaxID=2631580 RepID=UPI0012E791F3|nr:MULTISPECIES: hypothetical protein [Bradyrhizobium]UFW38471.1 hypothetical protein BcanWSM471_19695 [Bradyrhizobium canariense]
MLPAAFAVSGAAQHGAASEASAVLKRINISPELAMASPLRSTGMTPELQRSEDSPMIDYLES